MIPSTIQVSPSALADALIAASCALAQENDGAKFIPADGTSSLLVSRDEVVEVVDCAVCKKDFTIRIRLSLDPPTTAWGVVVGVYASYLLPINGRLKVPIFCPADGLLGFRLVRCAPLESPFKLQLLTGPYSALLDSRRVSCRYSGAFAYRLFVAYCPSGKSSIVVIRQSDTVPYIPSSVICNLCPEGISTMLSMHCPFIGRDIHYQKSLGYNCCGGFFVLLDVDTDPAAVTVDSVVLYKAKAGEDGGGARVALSDLVSLTS